MPDGVLVLWLILLFRSLLNSADPALVPARSILAAVLSLVLLARLS